MTRDFIDERILESLQQFMYTLTGTRMDNELLRHTYEVSNIMGEVNKKVDKCKIYRSIAGNTVIRCSDFGNFYIRHDGITISGLKMGVVDDV